jgi:NAD-dependent SIR2 family protein deacetylase
MTDRGDLLGAIASFDRSNLANVETSTIGHVVVGTPGSAAASGLASVLKRATNLQTAGLNKENDGNSRRPSYFHGALFGENSGLADPVCVTTFDVNARDYGTGIKAHEFLDTPEVLREKVRVLARLLRTSHATLAFTGAGISTAAGIDDYATKAKEESLTAAGRPVVKDWKNARPTGTHRVLAAMERADLLHHWLQQNHDSLPQKAGFPQSKLNEIHGSLHDIANSIVPYEGTLRSDLFQWMHEWTDRAQLCLALGTSMSGFNCDSVPVAIGKRFLEHQEGLGLVIVNLQQTNKDKHAALRIFAKTDDVFAMLAGELGIAEDVASPEWIYELPDSVEEHRCQPGEDVFWVPFDPETGLPTADGARMRWDLRIGSAVRLTGGPYAGDVGTVVERNGAGDVRARFENSIHPVFNVRRATFSLWLGRWWIECAVSGQGIVPGGAVPFVNVDAAAASRRNGSGADTLTKYEKMLKAQVPVQAVMNQMGADGVEKSAIDEFFARVHA